MYIFSPSDANSTSTGVPNFSSRVKSTFLIFSRKSVFSKRPLKVITRFSFSKSVIIFGSIRFSFLYTDTMLFNCGISLLYFLKNSIASTVSNIPVSRFITSIYFGEYCTCSLTKVFTLMLGLFGDTRIG